MKLGNKRPEKVQPKDEFPLRRLLKCWCGQHMTAGFSKGKKKYYLYYRCIEHKGVNIPGPYLHEKFDDLLGLLSFTEEQVVYIKGRSKLLLKEVTVDNAKILLEREKKVKGIDAKIDKLECKLGSSLHNVGI